MTYTQSRKFDEIHFPTSSPAQPEHFSTIYNRSGHHVYTLPSDLEGIKEFLYPFVEMIVFILCGFKLNSILGFIIYILITIIVTYIMLSDEFAYIFSYVSKIIKKNKRKPQ